jgi:hypothetical protein
VPNIRTNPQDPKQTPWFMAAVNRQDLKMRIQTEKGAKLQDNIHLISGREFLSLLVIEGT